MFMHDGRTYVLGVGIEYVSRSQGQEKNPPGSSDANKTFLTGMNGQDNGSGSSRNAMPCDGIVHWQICHRSLFGASYV